MNKNPFYFISTFVHREDLFKKHKLTLDTWDELYESLKVLKDNYPDSYPIGGHIEFAEAAFRTSSSVYYNRDKDEWVFGPLEDNDNYRKYVEYFAKLYNEKLLHPETFTMSHEQWSQSFVSSEIFVSWWWSATGNWFSPDNSLNNPDYGKDKHWVAATHIPKFTADGPRGWTSTNTPSDIMTNSAFLVSSKSKYIEEIMLYMDFITTQNTLVLNYGPAGEDWYYDADNKPRFNETIKVPYNTMGTKTVEEYYIEKYGTKTGHNNFILWDDHNMTFLGISNNQADADYKQFIDEIDMYVNDGSTILEPEPIMRPDESEKEEISTLKVQLKTYIDEETW